MDSSSYDIGLTGQIFIAISVILLFVLLLLSSRRSLPSVKMLIWLYVSLLIWGFGAIFESAANTVELKQFWSQVCYIGIVFTPVFLFLFVQDYTGIKKLQSRLHILLLNLVPVIILVLAWTNEYHHLIWQNITIQKQTNLGIYEHGVGFWFLFAYGYMLIFASWVILGLSVLRFQKFYRKQAVIIFLAIFFGVAGNVLYFSAFNPVPGMDWTLVGLIISAFLITYDIFRYRLFDLVPTARNTLVEVMDEGMLFIDSHQRILDLNPGFLKNFSIHEDPHDWLGKDIGIALREQPQLLNYLNTALSKKEPIRSEMQIENKSYSISIRPVSPKSGKNSGWLVIINDITSIKDTEKVLFDTNRELSKELKVKEELIEELDTYAHTVAHDLKSPLNQIAGFSELLLDEIEEKNEEKIISYSKIINTSSFDLVHIVDELLMLASVRSSEIQKSMVQVKPHFESAVKRLQTEINSAQATIHLPEKWPDLYGYGSWIQEIFVNYLSNALKYGGSPPEIWISSREEDGMVWYAVCDNGQGIPEEVMNKLFLPYSRLTPAKADGQGLGLSIVKRIADKLEGKVHLENTSERGARFSFGLPANAE